MDDLPVAFRAEATHEPRGWLRRPRRTIRYAAQWADGRVQTDVDLVALMYRRAPADYTVVRDAMHRCCPENGTGEWIQYPDGTPI